MRRDTAMVRFRDRRDLLTAGEAARKSDSRSHEDGDVSGQELVEFPDRAETLSHGDGAHDPAGDLGLRLDRIDLNRILDKERMKPGERVAHDDRLRRIE